METVICVQRQIALTTTDDKFFVVPKEIIRNLGVSSSKVMADI
jgi:hypothetical protein